MKLRTIEELVKGEYQPLDVENTVSLSVWKMITLLVVLIYLYHYLPFIMSSSTEQALQFLLLTLIRLLLYFIVSGIILLYFILCETYIN